MSNQHRITCDAFDLSLEYTDDGHTYLECFFVDEGLAGSGNLYSSNGFQIRSDSMPELNPYTTYISGIEDMEGDAMLEESLDRFKERLKCIKAFAKLHGYVDFIKKSPHPDWL